MNIFQNRDIFFGKPNFINIQSHIREFWSMAGEIKQELGESAYHLDRYLNVIFEVIADMNLRTALVVSAYTSIEAYACFIFGDRFKNCEQGLKQKDFQGRKSVN